MPPLSRATLVAIGQVALLPLVMLATMICVLAFILFTSVALFIAFWLLFSGRSGQAMAWSDIWMGIGALLSWFLSCRGIMAGWDAMFDLAPKGVGIAFVHAAVSAAACTYLLGTLW